MSISKSRKANKKKKSAGKRRKPKRGFGQLSARRAGKKNVAVSFVDSTGSSDGIGTVRTRMARGGFHVEFGTAPAHSEVGGRTGCRLHVRCCPWMICRDYNTVYKSFCVDAGSPTPVQMLSPNPLFTNSTTVQPLFVSTPFGAIHKLFTRYALRGLQIHYVPDSGLTETGTFAALWRPDVETTVTTWTIAKNTDGVQIGRYNEDFKMVAFKDDMSRPAARLLYVDPTNDASTNKSSCSPGSLIWVNPTVQTSSAVKVMGDLEVEAWIDCYCLGGDTAPSYDFSKDLTFRVETMTRELAELSKRVSTAPSERKEVSVELKEPRYPSNSTSSATSSVAKSIATIVEDEFEVVKSHDVSPKRLGAMSPGKKT